MLCRMHFFIISTHIESAQYIYMHGIFIRQIDVVVPYHVNIP